MTDNFDLSIIENWKRKGEDISTLNTPEYKSIDFNVTELVVDNFDDAEKVVEKYYNSLGFTVLNLRKEHQNALNDFPFFDDNYIDITQKGTPDLFIFRVFQELKMGGFNSMDAENIMQNWRFVEVKSNSDSLRTSQIRWMAGHNDVPVDLAIVKEGER